MVIISPGSLKSHWVSYEVGFSTARNTRVLPYLTHPALDPPSFINGLTYATNLGEVFNYFANWDPSKVSTIDLSAKLAEFQQLLSKEKDYLERIISQATHDASRAMGAGNPAGVKLYARRIARAEVRLSEIDRNYLTLLNEIKQLLKQRGA